MPWLDTGIESLNSSCRHALAGYRNQISKLFMQTCHGRIQVSNLQSVTHRYALARYRNRIWNWSSRDIPWLDTGVESLNSSCRHALAGYRYQIYNQLLTDMPWLDIGIESGISRLQICPGWIQVSNLEFVVYRYALAGYKIGRAHV